MKIEAPINGEIIVQNPTTGRQLSKTVETSNDKTTLADTATNNSNLNPIRCSQEGCENMKTRKPKKTEDKKEIRKRKEKAQHHYHHKKNKNAQATPKFEVTQCIF